MSSNAGFVMALFLGVISIVMVSVEVGYRIGSTAHHRAQPGKEKSVSVAANNTMLGLLAFMLAFTFGIAANRFDNRSQLVRDEANAIRTAWARSDFLPKIRSGRDEATLARVFAGAHRCGPAPAISEGLQEVAAEAEKIQHRLWGIALSDARKDLNSDIGALYIELLNEMSEIHASRVAVGVQLRIPISVWLALAGIIALAMMAVGYQFGVSGSKRTITVPVMAFSFAIRDRSHRPPGPSNRRLDNRTPAAAPGSSGVN